MFFYKPVQIISTGEAGNCINPLNFDNNRIVIYIGARAKQVVVLRDLEIKDYNFPINSEIRVYFGSQFKEVLVDGIITENDNKYHYGVIFKNDHRKNNIKQIERERVIF